MPCFFAELSTSFARGEIRVIGRGRLHASSFEAAMDEVCQFHETALNQFGAYLVRVVEASPEEWGAIGPDFSALAAGAIDLSLYR